MTRPFSDELISAYLDGELTAEEREFVAAQLRDNAELRRMCDELRSLRATLQAMPVAEPPEDFAERVLRQAERRMLSGDGPSWVGPSAAAGGAISFSQALTRKRRGWRVAIACAAALAASVLAVMWWPSNNVRDVAQGRAGRDERRAENEQLDASAKSAAPSDAPLAGPSTDTAMEFRAQQNERFGAAGEVVGEISLHDRAYQEKHSQDFADREDAPPVLAPAAPGQDPATMPGGAAGYGGDRSEVRDAPNMAGGMADGKGGGMGGGMGGLPGLGTPEPDSSRRRGTRGESATGGGGSLGGYGPQRPGGQRPNVMSGAAGRPQADSSPVQPFALGAEPAAPRESTPETKSEANGEVRGRGVAGEPVMDYTPSKGDLHSETKEGARLHYSVMEKDLQEKQEAVAKLLSQLNEQQELLVKVQIPQRQLLDSLGQLQKTNRVDVLMTDGRLAEASRPLSEQMQPDAAAQAAPDAVPSVQLLGEQLLGDRQNVLIVDGSADDIRQSLVDLVAQPGIAIDPAQREEELLDLQVRKLRRADDKDLYGRAAMSRLRQSPDQTVGPLPAAKDKEDAADLKSYPDLQAGDGVEPGAGAGELAGGVHEVQPSTSAAADKSSDTADQEPGSASSDVKTELANSTKLPRKSDPRATVYVYFRLLPETTQVAPPAQVAPPTQVESGKQ